MVRVNNELRGAIRRGQSCCSDARDAVRELHNAICQPDMAFVLFFCSSEYDLDAIADEMTRQFAGVNVIGCTTAGEIGPSGYEDNSLCGASFPQGSFSVATALLDNLGEFEFPDGQGHIQALFRALEQQGSDVKPENTFALMLIDGLSMREELVTRSFQNALDRIPLVGGSAGDGLNFSSASVYADGSFHTGGAVVALITTPLPFRAFKTQHFEPMEERLVVTAADAANRVVYEINGRPAADEYARVTGYDPLTLHPQSFAGSPVVVLIDGGNYVRSIQKALPDGSLKFFCAIEEGVVLRVARGVGLIANMEEAFRKVEADIGQPELVIACDCVLRKIEVFQEHLTEEVSSIFRRNNTIGFCTYGEQYRGVHINQTLTGIAIGPAHLGARDD